VLAGYRLAVPKNEPRGAMAAGTIATKAFAVMNFGIDELRGATFRAVIGQAVGSGLHGMVFMVGSSWGLLI